ncbi:phage tail fiber protein [Klebsiella aerogenes]|uniref:phage tail fiber domain-containing protein n=1 Tax=Klebsiella aerogenes TaxID=548 RepID=UPI0006999545|nr:phage tail fiber protein [Klebsiella aerogenes]HCW3467131.1 hypothetical protein [Klebsiella aerogenes]
MSVPNQTPYNIYTANGLTTVFTYEFYIISASDLQVSINGDVVTSGYTVAGVGNKDGGDITFLTPPANGAVVMLERVVPTYRLTDYQDNGDLLADTVNKDFDRIWMAIQRAFIDLGLVLTRPLFGGPYNAQGYRISNLADPVDNQDAATKKYVIDKGNSNLAKTLRVPEQTVHSLPYAPTRAWQGLGFDGDGQPLLQDPAGTGLWGYVPVIGSFERGASVSHRFEVVFWEQYQEYWRWDGAMSKSVPVNSTPHTSGGTGKGKWIDVTDATLRSNLASHQENFGGSLVSLEQGGNTQQAIKYITPQMKYAPANGVDYDTDAMIACLETGREVRLTGEKYVFECNKINLPSGARIYLDAGTEIKWVNNSGTSGSGQQAWGFMAQGVSNILISGGTYRYDDDTMVVLAVQSGCESITIEHARCFGPRLLDVADGNNAYDGSTNVSRAKKIKARYIDGYAQNRLTTGSFIQFRYTDGGGAENVAVEGYFYGGMFWGGDANFEANGEEGNERKCKNLTFREVNCHTVWAGVWGSMGDNILITGCRAQSIDPTHCDVGFDFEGCTNSRIDSCYAKNWANGGIATFFYNNQISITNCEVIVDNQNSRIARFYNSAQNGKAKNIVVENNRFRGEGIVSAIVQMGAADNLVFRNNVLTNVLVWLVANNNGYLDIAGNNFTYTVVPYYNFNDYGVYAMLAVGGFHAGGNPVPDALPAARASIRDNTFTTAVNFPGESYAIWALHVGYNNSSTAQISGGGTLSTGITGDICLVNAGANPGIGLRYSVKNFVFFNKAWVTKVIKSATLYPKGVVKGYDRFDRVWPNALTDNVLYANTWFDVRQEFELLTPLDEKRGDVVKTAGIGTTAVTRTY